MSCASCPGYPGTTLGDDQGAAGVGWSICGHSPNSHRLLRDTCHIILDLFKVFLIFRNKKIPDMVQALPDRFAGFVDADFLPAGLAAEE